MQTTAMVKGVLKAEVEEVGGEEATAMIHPLRILRLTIHVLRERRTLHRVAPKAGDRDSGLVPLEELLPDTWPEEWQETTKIRLRTNKDAETAGLVEATQPQVLLDPIQRGDRIRIPATLPLGTRALGLGLPVGDEL